MSGCVHYRFTTQITVLHRAKKTLAKYWVFLYIFLLSLNLLAAFVSTQSTAVTFTLATLIRAIPRATNIETYTGGLHVYM